MVHYLDREFDVQLSSTYDIEHTFIYSLSVNLVFMYVFGGWVVIIVEMIDIFSYILFFHTFSINL